MTKQEQLNNNLIEATKNGDLTNVKLLIKQGADIHVKNNKSLQCSATYRHLEIVKFLIIDCNMKVKKSTLNYLKKNDYMDIINIINSRDLYNQFIQSVKILI
jgi:hypothetical protein